ncbi:hypothetical protein BBF96_04605 [Anoxybacter fermentans]|uniref:Methyltransferase domain-containing protein n=1 Tax=Anoxybacter fermentans TaxID=1323375 RepID=A0A3Q9HR63_9FIRM|nr:class I SAM-dependent methyltransferase [Anoxybacter fermentans]AZR72734.1 hypothetical protein BBF96_04605 [Anoxybacter fermentans]
MKFYEDLSSYYADIFPLTEDKINLIEKYLPKYSKILDIGCGTGELVIALARRGYEAYGTDLSKEMIEKAKENSKKENIPPNFQIGDMRKLKALYHQPFDGMICFGNTIVHLNTVQEIKEFLQQVYELLNPGGIFIFQIVNYDRILDKGIKELPLIKNDRKGLKLFRYYDYDKKNNLIHFRTRLVLKDKKEFNHGICLYPLRKSEINKIMNSIGFTNIEYFGNFRETDFDPKNSVALVGVARKE